jgi:hypothetical protein
MTEPSDSSEGRDVTGSGDGHRQRAESAAVHVQRFATGYNVIRVGGELSGDQGPTLLRVVAEELERTPAHLAPSTSGTWNTLMMPAPMPCCQPRHWPPIPTPRSV